MSDCNAYIDANRDRFLEELLVLLRIPSVSADPAFAPDVLRCAENVAANLKVAGAENVEIIETAGYPVVYGDRHVSADLPTVLKRLANQQTHVDHRKQQDNLPFQ